MKLNYAFYIGCFQFYELIQLRKRLNQRQTLFTLCRIANEIPGPERYALCFSESSSSVGSTLEFASANGSELHTVFIMNSTSFRLLYGI